jgi:hypothetical protein
MLIVEQIARTFYERAQQAGYAPLISSAGKSYIVCIPCTESMVLYPDEGNTRAVLTFDAESIRVSFPYLRIHSITFDLANPHCFEELEATLSGKGIEIPLLDEVPCRAFSEPELSC